jgi:hypothetical protein
MNRGNPWNGYAEPTAGTELLERPQFDQVIREETRAVVRGVPEPVLACSTLTTGDPTASRSYYAAMAVVAMLICLPVWLVEYPPLVDYPNHIARCHYSTVTRHTFSPGLLAYPGQQPIRYRQTPLWQHASADDSPALADVDWERIFGAYDYIWCYNVPPDYTAFLERRFTMLASTANGVIYRVR